MEFSLGMGGGVNNILTLKTAGILSLHFKIEKQYNAIETSESRSNFPLPPYLTLFFPSPNKTRNYVFMKSFLINLRDYISSHRALLLRQQDKGRNIP